MELNALTHLEDTPVIVKKDGQAWTVPMVSHAALWFIFHSCRFLTFSLIYFYKITWYSLNLNQDEMKSTKFQFWYEKICYLWNAEDEPQNFLILFADTDECLNFPCLHGSSCINTPGGYECRCIEGWKGPTCATGNRTQITFKKTDLLTIVWTNNTMSYIFCWLVYIGQSS